MGLVRCCAPALLLGLAAAVRAPSNASLEVSADGQVGAVRDSEESLASFSETGTSQLTPVRGAVLWAECWPAKEDEVSYKPVPLKDAAGEGGCDTFRTGLTWKTVAGSPFEGHFPTASPQTPLGGSLLLSPDVSVLLKTGALAVVRPKDGCGLAFLPRHVAHIGSSYGPEEVLRKHTADGVRKLMQASLEKELPHIFSEYEVAVNSARATAMEGLEATQREHGIDDLHMEHPKVEPLVRAHREAVMAAIDAFYGKLSAEGHTLKGDVEEGSKRFKAELIKGAEEVFDLEATRYMQNSNSVRPLVPSQGGVCFSEDQPTSAGFKQDGSVKFCMCPMLNEGRSWTASRFSSTHLWMTAETGRPLSQWPAGWDAVTEAQELYKLSDEGKVELKTGGRISTGFFGPHKIRSSPQDVFDSTVYFSISRGVGAVVGGLFKGFAKKLHINVNRGVNDTPNNHLAIKSLQATSPCFVHYYIGSANEKRRQNLRWIPLLEKGQGRLAFQDFAAGGMATLIGDLDKALYPEDYSSVGIESVGGDALLQMNRSGVSTGFAAQLLEFQDFFEAVRDNPVALGMFEQLRPMVRAGVDKYLEAAARKSPSATCASASNKLACELEREERGYGTSLVQSGAESQTATRGREEQSSALASSIRRVLLVHTCIETHQNAMSSFFKPNSEHPGICQVQAAFKKALEFAHRGKNGPNCKPMQSGARSEFESMWLRDSKLSKCKNELPTTCFFANDAATDTLVKLGDIYVDISNELSKIDCVKQLEDAGLLTPRPDIEHSPAGVIDLTSYPHMETSQQLRVTFDIGSGQLNFYRGGNEKSFPLQPHADETAEQALERQVEFYTLLQNRIELCRVEKVGIFNFHYEHGGALMSDIMNMFGKPKRSGEIAVAMFSPAAVTMYRHGYENDFLGRELGSFRGMYGDPYVSSSPSAWYAKMDRLVEEEGWKAEPEYHSSFCLKCTRHQPGRGAPGHGNATAALGECKCDKEYFYVYSDPDGNMPYPDFVHYTPEAWANDVESGVDLRGLWDAKVLLNPTSVWYRKNGQESNVFKVVQPYTPSLQDIVISKNKATDIALQIPLQSIVGIVDYSKDQARKDTRSQVNAIFSKAAAFDYEPAFLDHCFQLISPMAPEERGTAGKAHHLGSFGRMRLCTNDFDGLYEDDRIKSFYTHENVVNSKVAVERAIQQYVARNAAMAPTREELEAFVDLGNSEQESITNDHCIPVASQAQDGGTCMGGLDMVTGSPSCVENPTNPCPEGTSCTCNTGLDTLGGQLKFLMALVFVQLGQLAAWTFSGILTFQVAFANQMMAGPSDILCSFMVLTLFEGKKSCECVKQKLPRHWRGSDEAKKGCLPKPMLMKPESANLPATVLQDNEFWFLPPPGQMVEPQNLAFSLRGIETSVKIGLGAAAGAAMSMGVFGSPIPEGPQKNIILLGVLGGLLTTGTVVGLGMTAAQAECTIVPCTPEFQGMVRWVSGRGFANCDGYGLEGGRLDYAKRVEVYTAHFTPSDATKHLLEDEDLVTPMRTELVNSGVPQAKELPVSRLVLAELKVRFPDHFGMPGGSMANGRREFVANHWWETRVPRALAQIIIQTVLWALDALGDAIGFIANKVMDFFTNIWTAVTRSKVEATIRVVVEHFVEECMSLSCLSETADVPINAKKLAACRTAALKWQEDAAWASSETRGKALLNAEIAKYLEKQR